MPPVLEAEGLFRRYDSAASVDALRGVSLTLARGEFLAVTGPSGCGKSTLLHICGAMDRPSAGEVRLDGVPLHSLTDDQLTAVRRKRVGFVFQFFNLLPTLTASENVALPLLLAGMSSRAARERAESWLERVGLEGRARHFPRQLSGGEMQRVALARALAHDPALVIADEPTGNLDSENGRLVLTLLQDLNRATGVALLLATHAPEIADAANRVLRMRDGRIDVAV
jgi:putative ABC transport system ATP-binding protein